jgi:hypothetical protein
MALINSTRILTSKNMVGRLVIVVWLAMSSTLISDTPKPLGVENLKGLEIREVSLKNFTLAEALAFLNTKCDQMDSDFKVQFLIDPKAVQGKQIEKLVLAKVSLYDFMRHLASLYGVKYTFQKDFVVVDMQSSLPGEGVFIFPEATK